MTQKQVERFVADIDWTFAKMYAKTAPHEYIVRDHLSDGDKKIFDEFSKLIADNGYIKKFYDTEYKYFDIGDKCYWVIENILNRADKKNQYE